MKTILISTAFALFAFGAHADGHRPVESLFDDLMGVDRKGFERDLQCMRARLSCMDGVKVSRLDTKGVTQSYQCIESFLNCMRSSNTQTANDLASIKLPF